MSVHLEGHVYYSKSNMSCGCFTFRFIDSTDSEEISTPAYSAVFLYSGMIVEHCWEKCLSLFDSGDWQQDLAFTSEVSHR